MEIKFDIQIEPKTLIGILIGGDHHKSVAQLFIQKVNLPCGNSLEFTQETFPYEDLECHCGTLPYRHWFVKYD